jgi:hypothetical protein
VFGKAHYLKLLLLLLRLCLVSLYACFGWDRSLMPVVACLTCFIHFMLILAHGYLLVILLCSLCEDSLLFCKFWHNGMHNCLNTCLYALWSTLILIRMHNILFFSRFVFDEFIVKGGEYEHKVSKTLANRVVERRNMINSYLRGRACIESVRGGWFQGGVLILSFSYSSWFCRFSCLLLAFTIFLLLDDLLELFVGFWSSSCASWGFGFKL